MKTITIAFTILAVLTGLFIVAAPSADATSPGINGALAVIDGGDLVLLDPETGVRTRLTRFGAENEAPSWSPDGQRIAYASGVDLMVINADGTGQTEVVGRPCGGSSPSWSPDGSRILYSGCEGLFTVNADGTDPQPVPNGAGKGGEWSPDGTKIAYAAFETGNETDIWVMDADGQNPVKLTDLPGGQLMPSWSPDGSRIAFQDQADGKSSVGVVDVDGTDLQDLTPRDGFDGHPSWSPDGTRIVFSSNRAGGGLFTMASDGTRVLKVPGSEHMGEPAWQPASLVLEANRIVIRTGRSITLRTRLAWPDGSNTEVDILRRAGGGGGWKLLETGHVDGDGVFEVKVNHVTSSATYKATWSGDAEHGAVTSLVVPVDVRATTTGRLLRYHGTQGQYRLYGEGDRVWFRGHVRPARRAEKMCFELQIYRDGQWRRGFDVCYPIARDGSTTIYIINSRAGVRARIRAIFRGDDENLADTSPWNYYRVTRGRSPAGAQRGVFASFTPHVGG